MKQRQRPVKTKVVEDAKTKTIGPFIRENVRQRSAVYADEWFSYRKLAARGFDHHTVNHGAQEWARDGVHTNSIEDYRSQLKRSIRGTHIHVSGKHLPKYLAEFDFRHNARQVPDRMFPILVDRLRPGPPA